MQVLRCSSAAVPLFLDPGSTSASGTVPELDYPGIEGCPAGFGFTSEWRGRANGSCGSLPEQLHDFTGKCTKEYFLSHCPTPWVGDDLLLCKFP